MDTLNDSKVDTIDLNMRRESLVASGDVESGNMRGNSEDESGAGPDGSDGDSYMDGVDISELKKRMWKDKILLRKLEGGTHETKSEDQNYDPCQCSLIPQSQLRLHQPSRKSMRRAEDGVLHYMLKIMQECKARGFVYGIVPDTGKPITGSSDNLRAWWKDTVIFEQNAPRALVGLDSLTYAPIVQKLGSYLHNLQEMNDNTIGSILSALIQHCEPPQRSFPFEHGMPPPWWPTCLETWWGLQGEAQAQLGPPPYRKPHDLRKGWKLSLLAAVIKHMSPQFDQLRRLVWQSKRLQRKMSGREVETWSRVLNQEEALVEQTKNSLVLRDDDDNGCNIDHGSGGDDKGVEETKNCFVLETLDDDEYVGDQMGMNRKRKCEFENGQVSSDGRSKEKCSEPEFTFRDFHSGNVEIDGGSLDELMRFENGKVGSDVGSNENCLERDFVFGDFHSDLGIDRVANDELMRLYYNSVQEGSSGDSGGIM